jgi:hypothetical protein
MILEFRLLSFEAAVALVTVPEFYCFIYLVISSLIEA